MADETADTARLEQMSLRIWHINRDTEVPTIRDDLLNCFVVLDLNGSGLASIILENLKNKTLIWIKWSNKVIMSLQK